MAVLHPQECYLLEKFISPEHYAATRDALIAFIDAHEAALDRHNRERLMKRHRALLYRHDAMIWERRVMPNLRPLKAQYIKACVARTHNYNDIKAFNIGHAMSYISKGIIDFCDSWMTEEERQHISDLQTIAFKLDVRLSTTLDCSWNEGHLTYHGIPGIYTAADIPMRIPRYELDPSVRIEADEIPTQSGIYLPDIDFAPARFIPANYGEPVAACQGVKRSDWVDAETGEREYAWTKSKWVDTGWTLIRRVEGEYIDVPPEGFFPHGTPEELYNWPQRESHMQAQPRRISLLSGEIAPYTARWRTMVNGVEQTVIIRKGRELPKFTHRLDREFCVRWSLLERNDGGSVFEEP